MKFLRKLTNKPAKLQRLIGLTIEQLNLLVKKIEPIWEEAEMKRLSRRGRKREIGGGHPYKLKTMRDKIATVLMYYKLYITQELLGYIVGVDQSAVSRILRKMLPIIEQAADPQLKTYLSEAKNDFQKRSASLQELWEKHPDLRDISTDATEQQCYRATSYDEQKKYYSGKKKQHSIKTQITASKSGRILDVTNSYPGSIHDKTVLDQEKTIEKFDKRVPHRLDSGYQGSQKDHPEHYLILPIKKPRGKELSDLAKEHNTVNSKRRIVAEHALAKIKKYRVFKGEFRQKLTVYNQMFRNVAALLNFKHNCVMVTV